MGLEIASAGLCATGTLGGYHRNAGSLLVVAGTRMAFRPAACIRSASGAGAFWAHPMSMVETVPTAARRSRPRARSIRLVASRCRAQLGAGQQAYLDVLDDHKAGVPSSLTR